MVDDFLEDSLVPQHYDDEAYLRKVKSSPSQLCPLPRFRIVKYAYQFKSERSLEMFNERMATHMDSGLSPFVGGATVALMNLFAASCRLSRATKQFLEKFGVHIRRLIIHQGGLYLESYVDFDILGFVNCVKKCLHHVPNLERLKIVGNCLNWYENGRISNLRLKVFQNELLERTPKLDKLDKLEFQYLDLKVHDPTARCWDPCPYYPYLEEIFYEVMIKPYYQSQLKNLSLDWPTKLLNFKLCNVKELSLFHVQCDLMETKFQVPVEKLTLSEPFLESPYNPLGIFKKFPRLRYLKIDKNILADCLAESNLPDNNVHTLEIMKIDDLSYVPENLNFVFPKLRYLILCIRQRAGQYIQGEINSLLNQKYDKNVENGRISMAHMICGGSSYDSSLWNILPQLEILAFRCQHDGSHYSLNNKGSKEESPFKCIVETREGHQRYQDRVSRLMKQCFTEISAVGNDLETSKSSQSNCSRDQGGAEEDKSCRKFLQLKMDDGIKEPHGLTFILPLLGSKDIFQCRLVNKQWRGIVDDFIGNSIVPQMYDDKLYLEKAAKHSPTQLCPLPKFRNVEYAYNFRSERVLELFNERMSMAAHMMDADLSPFVGGATMVTLDNLFVASPAPLLRPAVKEFLVKFGVYIRNLVIQQTSKGIDVVRFVEYVKYCLHHVPALERLKLVMHPPNVNVKRDQSEIEKIQWNIYGNNLLIRLPKLPSLHTCEFDFTCGENVPYMDQVFFGMMIKPFYQTQLTNLQLRGTLAENLSLKINNLKELSLQIRTNDSKKILQSKWPEARVEKLNLIIYDVGNDVEDFSNNLEVFNILRIFPFVRYLKLENIRTFEYYSTSLLYRQLSIIANDIHTLELTGMENNDFISDTFFRGFPRLRFLIIRQTNFYGYDEVDFSYDGYPLPERETGELKIANLFYGSTSYDSNIWQLLPQLEVFTLQYQNHSRELYGYQPHRDYGRIIKGRFCQCRFKKGTKDECPFINIVETRQGYQRYQERLSRLLKLI